MKLIVDADSMVYAAGFIADKDGGPESHAFQAINMIFNNIKEITGVDEMEVYLTGSNGDTSRKALYSDYKASRKSRRPIHFQAIRDYLVTSYGAEIVDDMEADDIVGIRCTDDVDNHIIVAIDKDLWTIPGLHYHWKHKKLTEVTDEEAARNYWTQVIAGDSADNVKGIPGVGPVGAEKILGSVPHWLYPSVVAKAYEDHGLSDDYFKQVTSVLRIARTKQEVL